MPEVVQQEPGRGWLAGYLFSGFRTIALASFLGLLGMLLSFLLVYKLSEFQAGSSASDPRELQRARLLRTFSNELVTLCNEFHTRVQDGLSSVDRMWIDRTLRRDLQFLQERMDDTMAADALEFVQLRAAVSRCASMAKNPEDLVLRRRTLDEVARAASGAEAYIGRVDAENHAGPRRVKVRFSE